MTDIIERLREPVDPDDPDLWKVDKNRLEAADEIERLRKDADVALWEATRLLESFVAEHFPSNADWKPQPDLVGVILQLSNAVVITRDYKAEIDMAKKMIERQDKEIKKLRVIADDGADEIERLREELRRRYEMLEELRQENEQLKVSLVRICGMAHNDQRVMEVRPRDDVMPGAFIAKLKRPR